MDKVFDLTAESFDEKALSDLREEGIKSYSVGEPEDKKIIVSLVTNKDEKYECIYHYKTALEIQNIIRDGKSLDLIYSYIKDFNYTEIVSILKANGQKYKLHNFNAYHSFWDGEVNFEKAVFGNEDVVFTKAVFIIGDIKFNNSVFGDGNVYFDNAKFRKGEVSFNRAQFGNGDVNFDEAQFDNNYISFLRAQFGNGKVSFISTQFGNGIVNFDIVQFGNGDISFKRAKFGDGNVSFNYVKFGNGNISFFDATFGNGDVSFAHARFGDGDVNFIGTIFGDGDVSFLDTTFDNSFVNFFFAQFGDGNVSYSYAHFGNGDVKFINTTFSVAYFDHAVFGNGDISFLGADAQRLVFRHDTFSSHINLRLNKIDELIIEDCIIEKTLKCDKCEDAYIQYKKLSFLNTVNLGQIYIDWDNNGVFNAINNGIKSGASYDPDMPFFNEQKASQFRMLKENFHNIGYYDDEDKAYLEYMKCKTTDIEGFIVGYKKLKEKGFFIGIYNGLCNLVRKIGYKLFGLIGGYGTRPVQLLGVAFSCLLIMGGVFAFFSNELSVWDKIIDGFYFSAITFLTIGFGYTIQEHWVAKMLVGIEGFIGLFLMSYFTVSVVRKILR